MQPNFTLKKLRLVSIRIFAIAMILGLTTQTSFSQNNGDKKVERRVIKNQKETESKIALLLLAEFQFLQALSQFLRIWF